MSNLLFDKKNVFSWANAEEARQYIGKEGYFSDYYRNDLECWLKAKLIDINCDSGTSSVFTEECGDEEDISFGLFIPADRVKQAEKKWRPFKTIDEFQNTLNIKLGSVLVYRRKDEPDIEFVFTFTGYKIYQPTGTLYSILLGGMSYTVKDLLDKYEWFNEKDGLWCPFGMEVEE